ncbi:MAG: hypothetical protein MN733_08665 [Nitrososphaera sp.]|nr:hypothetical protein [Nitrososphaera sp.]
MLNKTKKRYISVISEDQSLEAFQVLARRCSELFGSIALEKAALKVMRSKNKIMIVRCNLDQLDNVLIAIALAYPPMVSIAQSGSMRRLRTDFTEFGDSLSDVGGQDTSSYHPDMRV